MSCSGNCSSCGSDCQKQPLRHPNITGAILGQFMMEMAVRSQKNAAGEITEEQKNSISHRGKALRAMADFLKNVGGTVQAHA